MSFIDTDDPFSIAAKRIRSSVIRSTPEPQLPIQGKQQPTTYIIEPDLMESQTGKMNLPNDVAFDDAGFAYNTVTGNPVQVVRRPNVLPIAKTPDGFTPVMPKVLDIVGNVMSPLAAGRVPVKAGEVVLGSGAVRTMPETVKEITPFYSALERTVDNAKIGKADVNQWLGYLKNQPGVKQEELSWVLNNLPEGQISKQELSDIIKNNKIELKEVVKGGSSGTKEKAFELAKEHGWKSWDDIDADTQAKYMRRAAVEGGATPTKYHNYQLSGGENYQEMLLTLPDKHAEYIKNINQQFDNINTELRILSSKGLQNTQEYADLSKKYNQLYNQRKDAYEATGKSFTSSHWDEPNILAHVRYNDRNIPDVGKSLHLEEIQSDWHQAGRKQGYKGESNLDKFNELDKQLQEARADLGQAAIDSSQNSIGMSWAKFLQTKPTQEAKDAALAKIAEYRKTDARYLDKEAKVKELEEARAKANPVGKVPDAPFKKNWDELAFKRMLHKAANEGYDSVSWTPGEAQAARYDLSKHLDSVGYQKRGENTYNITAWGKNGGSVWSNQSATPEMIEQHLGKEMADKIIKGTGRKEGNHTYLEDLDLKIGGEGMKSFYDKMLVDKANALAKKYGAKVETKDLLENDKSIWWHGSASGDLRGGSSGLHLGTKKAAQQALEARIGIPADGKGWTGNREYGKTLLAGRKTLEKMDPKGFNQTGFNSKLPDDDFYPSEILKYADKSDMPMSVKPSVEPYKLKGPMSNNIQNPYDDFKANGYMKGQLKKGNPKNGYFYKNIGEDAGSISIVVPNGTHVEKQIKQPVHVLKLTPELRAKAKEGFPLFSSTPITTPVDYDPWSQNKKYKLTPIEGNPFK